MIRTFIIYLAILLVGILFVASMVVFAIPALQESTIILPALNQSQAEAEGAEAQKAKLEKDIAKLQSKLAKFTPTNGYMIINTTDNHYYLYKGKEKVRDGVCSTGKNERLVSADGEDKFYTPKGVRRVLRKVPNPVWSKPDWAFIEEGLPVPPMGHASRYEKGTLGKYKLELGNGYMIHGTVWKRFMGLNVTHGCVRLLDDDLEAVYSTMEVGSKVYIY
ncbi:MAG: L,D-transpeptidase [Verrucomicrobia bacterium]|nr:L,D-transpeptidase [Prolixibacteraceae bacterium]